MQLGMIGLGRMGANIVRRLMRKGHECVVYNRTPQPVEALAGEVTTSVITGLAEVLESGDTVIDGGNSYYRDDIRHAGRLGERGIHLLDCGTSGGVWGLDRGYCLMIGGDPDAVAHAEPIFAALAPGVDTAERTPGREGQATPSEQGYLHCGPTGAGHFVKMIHNGIEYGMMASLAEGLNTSCTTPTSAPAPSTATRRPPRWKTPSTTATTSTSPRSPRCGDAAV